jgi:hypothetical protein
MVSLCIPGCLHTVYVALNYLKLMIFLPQPPECLYHRHVPPHLAYIFKQNVFHKWDFAFCCQLLDMLFCDFFHYDEYYVS